MMREIRRLSDLLASPLDSFERRTELLELKSSRDGAIEVAQQTRLPELQPDDRTSASTSIISLGIFPKSRLPDMVARDAAGTELPLLGRVQRSAILTAIFLGKHLRRYLAVDGLSSQEVEAAAYDDDSDVTVAQRLHRRVQRIVAIDLESAREEADLLLYELSPARTSNMRAWQLGKDEAFRQQLDDLCETTHVLALITAAPGDVVVVRYRHSVPVSGGAIDLRQEPARPHLPPLAALYDRASWFRDRVAPAADRLTGLYLALLSSLGMASTTLSLRNLNVNHCQSIHLLTGPLPGAEIVRAYWSRLRFTIDDGVAVEGVPAHSNSMVLSVHNLSAWTEDGGTWFLEVRPARSGQVRTAFLLSTVLAAVSAFIYRHAENVEAIPSAALLVAIPAALTGVLAQHRDGLTATVLRGPRRLLTLLAATTGLLGLFATSKDPDRIRLVALMSFTLALFTAGVIAFILLRRAPSRNRGEVQRNQIRTRQWRERALAAIYFPVLLLGTLWMVAALSSTSTMAVSEAEMWNGVLQPAKDACGWLTSLAT